MAKKWYITTALVGVLALAVLAPGALAAVTGNQVDSVRLNKMFDEHKQWVIQAVENGEITPEQGEAWNQHFDQMKEFHAKSGLDCHDSSGEMMGGPAGHAQCNSY
ncbi:hypothetical membrane protein [Pelotomaculum thermopropionicum SI]|uniref:Hypothetical membrane protein n=1 Tax=Pelotomaculum thermopropionicum (strain DSM 13744 / JCM 10971 / SI) TaxID=370438 RepID=A5D5Q6_PELTS|nr:hypothetical membrane protein [Pelotomaculum thermopropionicum SI]